MAREVQDDCVGCDRCIGSRCKNHESYAVYTCDRCGKTYDSEELYDIDGSMYCADCVLGLFKTVAQKEEEGEIYG